MMKSYKVLLFTALAIAMLGTICFFFPNDGLHVAGVDMRFPTLLRILNPQKQMDIEAYLARQDSIEAVLQSRKDSLEHFRREIAESDIRFWLPGDEETFFDPLFAAMEGTKHSGRTIRIMHYGDSQIEMDRITNRLRSYMQGQFGGGGAGFVPFSTIISSLGISIYGTGSLVHQSPFGDSTVVRAGGNYGPMVQDFRVTGSAQCRLHGSTSRSCDERLQRFSHLTLIFNNRPGPLSASCSAGSFSDQQQCEEDGVHAMVWHLDTLSESATISVSGTADLYGIMVDAGPGVAVDNIPMRGCSGHQFTQINADQLAAAYALMDVGLIILQFGGNSVPYLGGEQSIAAYCKQIGEQIDRIHSCCPNAKILFIGPSDMSTRDGNGDFVSYSCLPKLVESLCQMANTHGAAFWSIYHAMGGHNTMAAWVNQGLAGPDYIHFTQRGADIMGDRLSKAFDNMYQLYKMRKDVAEIQ